MDRNEIARIVGKIPGTGGRGDYVNNLITIAGKLPKNAAILEIGTFNGGSAITIALSAIMNNGLEKMYTIDPCLVELHKRPADYNKYSEISTYSLPSVQTNLKENNLQDIITLLHGTSEEILNIWEQKYNEKFDLIYIDGEHTYNAMKIDIQWERFAKDKAMILLDDWIVPVKKACDEYFANRPKWKIRQKHTFWPIYFTRNYDTVDVV